MPKNYSKERGPSTRGRKVEYDIWSLARPLYLSIKCMHARGFYACRLSASSHGRPRAASNDKMFFLTAVVTLLALITARYKYTEGTVRLWMDRINVFLQLQQDEHVSDKKILLVLQRVLVLCFW
jgi:hypothetical protein